jgi:TRAP-type mannitol/chloroaromatic compound transport system substrate-binding protein
MMRNKFIKLTGLAILGLVLAVTPVMAKQYKLVSAFPSKLPIAGEGFLSFIERVKVLSAGEIDFKFYEPGKLVPAFAVLDTVSKGQVAAGFSASPYEAGKMPAAAIFLNVPFGPVGPERLAWLYQGGGLKLWQELYDAHGYNVKILPILQIPSESAGWFNKEIKTVADMKGMRMRIGGLGGATMTKLGASVSMIPFGDVPTALQTGALDGAEASFPTIDVAYGLPKILKIN